MKRRFALLLVVVIAFLCASCSANTENKPTEQHDAVITKAMEELKDCWEGLYKESKVETDGYFEIKNTRVLTIKENNIAPFDKVKYIIEFELYTDYYGSAPYYEDVGVYDTVVVYDDGTMEVEASNLIRAYRSKTYQTDYAGFIQTVDDYRGYYNSVEKLK